MKKLFLASSFVDVASLFEKFAGADCSGKSVTFIPTASLREEVTFYVDTGKEALEKRGFVVDELEVSTSTREEIDKKLKTNDYIYIPGGNTFFLLQELKRTGADKIIVDQINQGKKYIGESAGSIVLSSNIEYIKEMDGCKAAPNLGSFSSLGIIEFYPLPHFTNAPFKDVVEKIISVYGDELDLCPISNKQAIVVSDNGYEVWCSEV